MRNIYLTLFTTALLAGSVYADNKMLVYPPLHINPNASPLEPSGMFPAAIRQAYGIANFPLQGEGQVIGIIDAFDNPNIESDLAVFNNAFGLPACSQANDCLQIVYSRGTQPESDPTWTVETALDVEWAHAIAPKARILLVESPDNSLKELAHASQVAVKNGANVVSLSWGTPEFPTENQFDRTFNVRYITFVAAAGDAGAATLYPAASPYVLSVGGTSLTMDSQGNHLKEVAWPGSGGGLSVFEKQLDNQRKFPLPNNFTDTRGIPDVAYHADPLKGFAVYSSTPYKNQSGWFMVGGTSAGTPQWAAIVAIANELVGEGLNINTVLYRMGKAASYHSNFYDIRTGSNGDCGYFCNAHQGYDYVTGHGSPKMPTLARTIYQYYLKKDSPV